MKGSRSVSDTNGNVSPGPDPVPVVLALAAWATFALSFLVVEVYDLDVFWNVTIGRDIVARFEVPSVDRYTAAGLGHPYHDIHWFFQVALAIAHRLADWAGVGLLVVLIWMATWVLVLRMTLRRIAAVPAALLIGIAVVACAERFLPRPEIVTFLSLAIYAERLDAGRFRSWADRLVLVATMLVWVNSHGLFVLGIFLVAARLAPALLAQWRGQPDEAARPLTVLLGLLLAATLVTPEGPRSWSYAWLLVTHVGPSAPRTLKAIGELSPTFGKAFRTSPAFWAFLALLVGGAAGAVRALRRRSLEPAALLVVAAMAALAMTGRRNVVLLALVAPPFVAGAFRDQLRRPVLRGRAAAAAVALLLLGASVFPLTGRYYVHMEIPARFGLGATPSFFPWGAPEALARLGVDAQVWNSNTIGGFLMFACWPRCLPLTDGRWTAYDDAAVERILAAPGDPILRRWVIDRWRIGAFLLHHTSPEAEALLPVLARDSGWRLAWFDAAASIWLPAEHPASAVDPAVVPLPRVQRLDDALMLDVFFGRIEADRSRLRNLERALAFGPRRLELLRRKGDTEIRLGQLDDAERTYGAILAEKPSDPTALNEMAFFAFRRGDAARAESLLLRALESAPDNVGLRENLDRVRAAKAGRR